jgi:LacI family transcriptional regulator
MPITIREIAEIVGVSRGTVDRVVNNRGNVRLEIAERIMNVIDEMGYVPNKAGKALVTRKHPVKIGCFLPSVGNAFFDDVIKGFRAAESDLKDFGLSVEIRSVHGYNTSEHISTIYDLVDNGCSALCISTIDVSDLRQCINNVIDSGIPVITVNNDLSDTDRLCYVGSDYMKGGKTAGRLLAMFSGFEPTILTVTGSLMIKGHNDRINGFLTTLAKSNSNYSIISICESLDDDEHAYEVTLNALQQHPETNCIYITAAGVAGTCKAIADFGLRNMHPTHVISFDDIESTRRLLLSNEIDFTICQEPYRQGYQAIHSMFNYFLNNKRGLPPDYYTETVIKISENI